MVLLVAFVAAAVGLYLYLVAFPKLEGLTEKTIVLEIGELPVLDSAEVLVVRNETLYGAKAGGTVTYEQAEGTKVRKGVKLITVEPGGTVATDAAIDAVRERAGKAMKQTGTYRAKTTAVVSYYSDGCEKLVTAKNIASITRGGMEALPTEGVPLGRDAVDAGDPVYKLTDNNDWYMVYWTKVPSDMERYATGASVTVAIGDASVGAKVAGAVREGADLKVTLRSDMYYEALARVRRVAANIEFAKYNGLVADNACISQRDGADGVFVKQRGGSYKWVPVKILNNAGEKCTLATDKFLDGGGNEVKTVDNFDEVLANPTEAGYK